jgi:hypothetical protein
MRILSTIAIIAFLGTQAAADGMAVQGAGTATCGEFAQVYRLDPSRTELVFGSWAQGFVSGQNRVTLHSGRYVDLSENKIEGQNAYLRRYCDEHPLAPFYKGVIEYYGTLPERTFDPKPR